MDADLARIHTFSGESITLAENLPRLEQVIRDTKTVLLIIDPLSNFIGVGNHERGVRKVLTGLRRVAEEHGVAVLAIRHLAKARFAAQLAGLGSVAIGAVARSGLLLAPDPADGAQVVLAQYKCNLAPLAPSLRLEFEGVRLSGVEECNLPASDLVRPTAYDEHSALGEAMSFLRATLAEGAVRTVLLKRLANDAGIKYRTLRKAKDALGAEAVKSNAAFDAPWLWRLPGDDRLAPDVTREDAPRVEGPLLDLLNSAAASSDDQTEEPEDADNAPQHHAPSKPGRAKPSTKKSEMDIEVELASLTGLASVKQSVRELRGLMAVSAARKRAKLPMAALSFHAVFVGNPGTGKTTVARIYARLLKQFGQLSTGHVVEVDRGQLVGQYLGETAIKTRNALEAALGGVLFIDEAYALVQGHDDMFGYECVDTILKFMEDHRNEMVVILAGYPDEMEALLGTNPGFRSRFTQRIVFDDYGDGELIEILRSMLRSLEYRVDPLTEEVVARLLAAERVAGKFANGRAVRNLVERAIRHQAVRLDTRASAGHHLSPEDLVLLTGEDFAGLAGDAT
jgi:stage V sporulation protein K